MLFRFAILQQKGDFFFSKIPASLVVLLQEKGVPTIERSPLDHLPFNGLREKVIIHIDMSDISPVLRAGDILWVWIHIWGLRLELS